MSDQDLLEFVNDTWEKDIMPTLEEYITIPNVSGVFEADWQELGHMERAVMLLAEWSENRPIEGMTFEIHRIEGRAPVLFAEIPAANGGSNDDTVFLYGHLDKQPEMFGWRDGLGPWTPVIEGDRLYGRGGADDGYATFASLTAIEAARQTGFPHARCVVLIEASEESGSPTCRPTSRRWPSGSARRASSCASTPGASTTTGCGSPPRCGVCSPAQLDVSISTEGVHSGDASGVMPSTFRIARQILSRIEDEAPARSFSVRAARRHPAGPRSAEQATPLPRCRETSPPSSPVPTAPGR